MNDALRTYGRHKTACAVTVWPEELGCTCGLEEALKVTDQQEAWRQVLRMAQAMQELASAALGMEGESDSPQPSEPRRPEAIAFGSRVRAARTRLGMDQGTFGGYVAQKAQQPYPINRNTVYQWEVGRRQPHPMMRRVLEDIISQSVPEQEQPR